MAGAGCIYVFVEGTADEILSMRASGATPAHYKVGKAESRSTKRTIIASVQKRQANEQSCNVRPIGCLRLFQCRDGEDARLMEAAFWQAYGEHGVRAYPRHEWYRGSLPIAEVATWMANHGACEITDEYPLRHLAGGYEEGHCEFKDGTINALAVYLMRLEDQGAWWRVLATSYFGPKHKPHRWYNTGNPRLVEMVATLAPRVGEDVLARNEQVKRLMKMMFHEFGEKQCPVSKKARQPWHSLAWAQDDRIPAAFMAASKALGLI